MIFIILAALGVPLWLIVLALLGIFWSHRHVQKTAGVFACKLRAASGTVPGLKANFPRVSSFAIWVHDVLIVHSGLALIRARPLPVAAFESLSPADPSEAKRLGKRPQLVVLRLDSGAVVQVAAAEEDAALLLGPFSAAASASGSSAE